MSTAPPIVATRQPRARRPLAAVTALRRRPMAVASIVLTLVAWQVVSMAAGENRNGDATVPSLFDALGAFKSLAFYWKGGLGVPSVADGGDPTWEAAVMSFLYNTGISAVRMAGGMVLGVAVGIGLAIVVSWSSLLRRMFALPSHFARMMPLLAMVPLFSLWFGDTMQGAILFIAFTAFVLVYPITVNAIGNVASHYEQYARSLGASSARVYFTVVLPAALPEVRSGIMLAVGLGWSATIAAEYLGQPSGLGSIAQNAQYFVRTDLLALVALISLVLAAISFFIVRRALAWATRWSE
ncbi:MAG: ABC transporter permease subunit [Solirubrobacteraceae bacterium]